LFCGKCCFNHQNKVHNTAASKAKGRVPCHNDGLNPKINSMAVLVDGLTTGDNYNVWHSGYKQNGAKISYYN